MSKSPKRLSQRLLRKRKKMLGFTLIELLVSLTVMGVILGVVAAGLQLLSNSWQRSTDQLVKGDTIIRAIGLFQRDVEALRRIIQSEDTRHSFIFSGDEDEMSFIVVEPPYPSYPGLYFVRYRKGTPQDGSGLIRERAQYEKDIRVFPGATPANQVILFENNIAYRFSYASLDNDTVNWEKEWTQDNRLPQLIKLELLDPANGTPLVAPFVSAVRIDAEQGCASSITLLCSPKTRDQLTAVPATARGQTRNIPNPADED